MERAYQVITDRVLAELDHGAVPWRKSWSTPIGQLPRNAISNRPYHSINAMVLGISGFTDPRWLTFNGARQIGGNVKQGAKASPVVFWRWIEAERENEAGQKVIKNIPFLRYYRVFNVAQCESLTLPAVPPEANPPRPVEAAEAIAAAFPGAPTVQWTNGDVACYVPSADVVRMPPRAAFRDPGELYSVLFHELTHSTGHPSRLRRFDLAAPLAPFGSEDYSKEELVAEFGSCFLNHEAGIESTIPNSVAYIQNWAERIRKDPKLVMQAAGKANHAANYILGRKESQS